MLRVHSFVWVSQVPLAGAIGLGPVRVSEDRRELDAALAQEVVCANLVVIEDLELQFVAMCRGYPELLNLVGEPRAQIFGYLRALSVKQLSQPGSTRYIPVDPELRDMYATEMAPLVFCVSVRLQRSRESVERTDQNSRSPPGALACDRPAPNLRS